MPPRVLIACPTYRLEPETVDAIFTQDWKGECDVMFTRDNPIHHDKKDHLYNYVKLRDVFLRGNYDYLWIVESDVIPPTHALRSMLEVNAPIVTGVYMLRRGQAIINIMVNGLGNPISNHPDMLKASWGKVIDCKGCGFGCLLLDRSTVEWWKPRLGEACHCDWTFVTDAIDAKLTYKAHLGVICGHKRPDGVVLLPPWHDKPTYQADESRWHYYRAFNDLDPRNGPI